MKFNNEDYTDKFKFSKDFKFELDFEDSFDYMIGHEFIEVSKEKVVTKLIVKTHHKQPGGLVHGGVYASIAESSCSFGANATGKGSFVGINQSIDFIKSVKSGFIRCESTPISTGSQIQIWEAKMYIDDTLTLCAVAKVKLFNTSK